MSLVPWYRHLCGCFCTCSKLWRYCLLCFQVSSVPSSPGKSQPKIASRKSFISPGKEVDFLFSDQNDLSNISHFSLGSYLSGRLELIFSLNHNHLTYCCIWNSYFSPASHLNSHCKNGSYMHCVHLYKVLLLLRVLHCWEREEAEATHIFACAHTWRYCRNFRESAHCLPTPFSVDLLKYLHNLDLTEVPEKCL